MEKTAEQVTSTHPALPIFAGNVQAGLLTLDHNSIVIV